MGVFRIKFKFTIFSATWLTGGECAYVWTQQGSIHQATLKSLSMLNEGEVQTLHREYS